MTALALRQTFALSRRHGFLLLLLCLFMGLSVAYFREKVVDNRSAVLRWQNQILQMEAGDDPYERYNYPNPPIMAILLTPLAHLPPAAFALAWFYLKVVMALSCFYWVIRMLDSRERPFPRWARNLAVALSLTPIVNDLTHGNVNLFILFTIVGGLYSFHRNRNVVGGLMLALGAACKVTPVLFVPYFLWKRAWRMLAATLVGLFVFLWLVPGAVLGWERNHALLASWSKQMVAPFLVNGVVTSEHNNQSLPGLATRLLTHSPSFSEYDWSAKTSRPVEWHNMLDLDRPLVSWMVKGCMLAFALMVLWRCRTPAAERRSWRTTAEFSVVILGMLLFSERTWKHHCVTFLLPIAVLCYQLSAERHSRAMRMLLWTVLGAVVLLMASTSMDILDRFAWLKSMRMAKMAQVYGAYVWAYVLLLAGMIALLGRRQGQAAEPTSLPLVFRSGTG
jgi:alpha-1,2-mannosyltransferase